MMRRFMLLVTVVSLLFCCSVPTQSFAAESSVEGENVMSSLSDTQRNSIGVLNYLVFLTKEIETQKDNRMYLESAYASLYNNTYMNSIDAVTLYQVKNLLTALNNFKMLTVKRERLEYIYEQNQAQAIRDAVPNPLAVMNIVQSGSWQKALVSIVYTVVDSASSYYSSKNAAEFQYLQDGWELNDKESEILHQGHLESLGYMWEIIHDYDLPGDLAISENDMDRFVDWKNDDNLISRIQFLESNQQVYQAFGEYWLTLAESYYSNGDMGKCLEAVKSYETYGTRIFRKDYHYAKTLPLAITAATEVYDNEQYITEASRFAARIISNCDQEDWVLRYFAAETYVDLAGRTSDDSYLQKAYDIALDNVNYLSRKQSDNNKKYMSEIKPEKVPDGSTDSKKKEIENYNKGQAEARKVAVPPVSEALVLNCDLLFSLAEQLNINESEQNKITGILYWHGDALFLNPIVDDLYSFDSKEQIAAETIKITFNGKEIKIPARYLTEGTKLSLGGLDTSGKTFSVDGWTVKSVERKNMGNIDTFIATLTSPEAANIKYPEGTTVWIDFNSYGDDHTPEMRFVFSVSIKNDLLLRRLVFQRIE